MRIDGFTADDVGPNWAQHVDPSYLRKHYLVHPNMEINLHDYFTENYWFPGDGVDPD